MSLWSRITNTFRGSRVDREIDEELGSHLAEGIREGRDPAEVRQAFGSALQIREASRDLRLIAWLESLRADVIFGWRQLMKRKGQSHRRARSGHAGPRDHSGRTPSRSTGRRPRRPHRPGRHAARGLRHNPESPVVGWGVGEWHSAPVKTKREWTVAPHFGS